MSPLPGYRQLESETLDNHYWALTQTYPVVEIVYDYPQMGQVAWCLSMASNGVVTERGNQYDIYLPYQFTYPDSDPVAVLDPQPQHNSAGSPPPHVYRLSGPGQGEQLYAVCVHDLQFDKQRWTPIVGFNLALCWLLQYEDWLYDGREFPKDVPADIQARVNELVSVMAPAIQYMEVE